MQAASEKMFPKGRSEKRRASIQKLYDIIARDDGEYQVILPGLIDYKRGAIVGTTTEKYPTKHEAETAIEKARQKTSEVLNRSSLIRTFGSWLYRIDQTKDGNFRVTLPGLRDLKNGQIVGATHEDFSTWEEAQRCLLEAREKDAELTKKPIVELRLGSHERIAFSDLEAFKPRVAPTIETYPIPSLLRRDMFTEDKLEGEDSSAMTYRETLKDPEWKQKLFGFVTKYLEQNATILKELRIQDIESLSPREAIELTTRLVLDLTKYYTDKKVYEPQADHVGSDVQTQADRGTVEALLREGIRNKNDESWQGNGVCRNFASAAKAVFEAIKEHQGEYSRLRNTYCLYESGKDEDYKPQREHSALTRGDRGGHAWNTFVTLSKEGAVNATTIDVTWAKRDLETGKINNLDQTFTRMEPYMRRFADRKEVRETPGQLEEVARYYLLKLEREPTSSVSKPFYAQRLVQLAGDSETLEFPPTVVATLCGIYESFAEDVDAAHLGTLFRLSRGGARVQFDRLLQRYVEGRELKQYRPLLVQNVDLQREIFERIKKRPDFDGTLKENMAFRIRIRETMPQLLMDFAPELNEEDAKEMIYLLKGSRRGLEYLANRVNPKHPDAAAIARV
ncbi:hypothetical protein FJZ48_04515, partial [Candidatus Uhrbacteria bacterium]|nr:hypothetical protein [Candidatus Uhrbacteria bacterium]